MGTDTLWESAVSDRPAETAGLPRHLLIISRYHPGLYEYVRGRFANEDNVQVVLDRRRGRERRLTVRLAGPERRSVERRSADRRTRPHVDTALRMESMQFVTIVAAPASNPLP
jgi:hypothetical protein